MTGGVTLGRRWYVILAVAGLIVIASNLGLWLWGKSIIEHSVDGVREEHKALLNEFQNELKLGVQSAVDGVTVILSDQSNEIVAESLSGYVTKLRRLQEEIDSAASELEKVRSASARAREGLPELVELDDLKRYYTQKISYESTSLSSYNRTVLEFETSKGWIGFVRADVVLETIPSTDELAWVRIGKNNSTGNSELILAWLSDSREVKKKLGYEEVSNETKRADYGNYTEVLLEKGDMYFKTYYQYQRVQGTYARHSMQYSFFVETGSKTRRERAKLEKFNSSLGS